MTRRRPAILSSGTPAPWLGTGLLAPLLALVLGLGGPAAKVSAQETAGLRRPVDHLLIHDDLRMEHVQLLEIAEDRIVIRDERGIERPVDLDRCVALVDLAAWVKVTADGMLELTDGQHLPGRAISNDPPDNEALAWNHNWMGRLSVPLETIRTLRFTRSAPVVAAGMTDQVLLVNGDRLDGLVVSLGDPVLLELTTDAGSQVIEVPLSRIAALAMITPRQTPRARRVWFVDGTVIEVSSIRVGDDGYARLWTPWVPPDEQPLRQPIDTISAVLFTPGAIRPLSELGPQRVEGPPTRYRTPMPRLLNEQAPLELSGIEFRGPLVARFALPPRVRRFAAEARLPEAARRWGDFELIVKDDDEEVFSSRLNAENPVAMINVELAGSELTIQLTEGRYGPIQDRLVLERALVLVDD